MLCGARVAAGYGTRAHHAVSGWQRCGCALEEGSSVLYLELGIVTVLIVVNGLLAMSELAIVSSRPARLAGLVEKDVKGSRRALALASDPGKFLSTVQIGITLIGVLSGAFSGATLGQRLASWLTESGLSQGLADAIGVGIVVTVITYASLIVGELVPKQIALRDPEAVAVRVAPAMVLLAKISLPLVWLLDRSGKALLWLLGHRGEAEEKVSEDGPLRHVPSPELWVIPSHPRQARPSTHYATRDGISGGPRGTVSQRPCGVMPAWPFVFYCLPVRIGSLRRPLLGQSGQWPPAEAQSSLWLVTADKLADRFGASIGFGCGHVI